MTQSPGTENVTNNEMWTKVLAEGHLGKKTFRNVMRMVPSAPRCKICNNPFGGIGGHVFRAVGLGPSKKNPRICSMCCENMPRGGAETEAAIIFADIRGSTGIAERLGPARYAEALNKFYIVATDVLVEHNGTIDKFIGDEVMGFFVPGFAGNQFKRAAVDAGKKLLREMGYGGASEPELPIGVGIDAGVSFVGNVGGEDFVDFTVLGDPVNTAARIQAAAEPGELLVGENLFAAVGEHYPGSKARPLKAKGKKSVFNVHSVPLTG